MKIESGLFAGGVLQRDGKKGSAAVVRGTADGEGVVVARVRKGGKVLKGWERKRVGRVRGGKFEAEILGVGVGGPYEIELGVEGSSKEQVASSKKGGGEESRKQKAESRKGGGVERVEKVLVRDVWVGDVWIAAGQSNMQGSGELRYRVKGRREVRAFYMDDRWGMAEDPIHNMWATVDQVHLDLRGGRVGVNKVTGCGPAVSFGLRLFERTGVPVGILACAHGGTSMAQWDPARKNEVSEAGVGIEGGGGRSLYAAMLRRVRKNGGKVAGMIWYQGESDANMAAAKVYEEKMRNFIAEVRADLGNAGMLVVGVQISRVLGWDDGRPWNMVQEAERKLGESVRGCVFVPAVDLPLDDAIHVGREGPNVLGRRMGEAAATLMGVKGALPGEIRLKGVKRVADKLRGSLDLVAEFGNVVGGLRVGDETGRVGGGLASGFNVSSEKGGQLAFDVKLDGARAILRTGMGAADSTGVVVHYGLGANPMCNVRDGAGRSVPVFGPVVVGEVRAMTDFVRGWEISGFMPGAGKLEGLGYPSGVEFKGRTFVDKFASLRPEIAARGSEDAVIYYKFGLECAEGMKLKLLFGYDGPVKVWVDGEEIYWDPKGTNPALVDAHGVGFEAGAGRHEVMVALGTNFGRAWGVFMRVWRTDVSKEAVREGGVVLPGVR